ncbi:autotransporter family protein [Candidimonas nitroreducens]|uniref:Autotransporter outer membrane beta-barrel domain-containing protein n=1 Tax=Candidimonas nitroreducens TaxID=683354 RepID=A0A225M2D4_9BURK|nr:autotransporter outer membrane beta-barrel domain-containing protein [Candidimonas nitroreducens]OWT54852.1 autotransporter outer membrane beta-barrel domain-containing protein [Candidimonas nitroreducens]
MANRHSRANSAAASWGRVAVRAAGIAFLPVLLPAAWTGSVDTAWAACSGQPDGSYLCSGVSSGESLTSSAGPLTIVADGTLKIDSSGAGFDIGASGSSNIVFSQESGSVITGGTDGINADQSGTGTTRIVVGGNVAGNGDNGIFSYNEAGAGNVAVEQTAGTITGLTHGIRIDNYGIGAAAVTTAGSVIQTGTGWDTYGVYVYNDSTATDITLTQTGGTVSGHYFGLYGNNQGTGSITISSAGDVTAVDQTGVAAYNQGSSSKDIRISQTAGTINGNENGILAYNGGIGSTHITTAGTAISEGAGVVAYNESNASDLSVIQSAGTIAGGVDGIDAWNMGSGATSVVVNGEVSGGTGAAIQTLSLHGATVDIASTATVGTSSGLAIQDLGTGNTVVTSAGKIKGDTSLGPGDDTFNLIGGSYSGNIFGDDRDDPQSSDGLVNSEGNDTFVWTQGTLNGGFYGQDGSDTATVSAAAYDGSQVLDGGDDTSSADGMVDTLNLQGVKASAKGSSIVNWEIVRLDGGTLAINDGAWKVGEANEDNTGVFLSNGATLDGMAALALDGRLNIDATSSFVARGGGAGIYSISGDLHSAGTVSMQDGAAGDVLTVAGNYVGTDGSLLIDTVLGDDSSRTDRLLVGGDTAGTTRLLVNNVGGKGAPTAEGIRVIGVGGKSDGSFSLVGDYAVHGKPAIVAGAYAYQLYQGGVSTPGDGDWYLRSQLNPQQAGQAPVEPATPLYQAGVPSYEAYPQALLALNSVPTLQERVGNRYWAGAGNQLGQNTGSAGKPPAAAGNSGAAIEGSGAWGRVEGAYSHIKPQASTSDTTYDQNIYRLQIGVDRQLAESDHGKLIGGLAAHYAHGRTDTKSAHGDGEIDTDGYGVGATLTWYGANGIYLDGQARLTWYDSDLSSGLARRSLAQGNDGFGYASSLEGGKRIALGSGWSVTPQTQLVYSNVDFDTFTDAFGARVSNARGESLQGRLGVALDHESSGIGAKNASVRTHVYGVANLHYEFLNGTKVDVAGESFASRNDRLWASLGVGGSYNWDNDKYSLYGEGLVDTSLNQFGNSYSVIGRVGFRMRW